jgi:multisubunit Na+/H+ antiporter MnhF subunit
LARADEILAAALPCAGALLCPHHQQAPPGFPSSPAAGLVCYADGVESKPSLRDAGGTPGGLGQFLAGLAMASAGGYLLTRQVTVMSSVWNLFGMNAFGLTLVPMFDGRSVAGWLLTIAGAVFILAGIIANLHVYFEPTSLFNTLVMLLLLASGLGLIARSLRPYGNALSGEKRGEP